METCRLLASGLQELNLSGEVECDLEVSNCAQIALAHE